MKFRVTGADRITGQEAVLVIDANSEEEAASIASTRGLLTASVVTITPIANDQPRPAAPAPPLNTASDHGLIAAGKWLGAYADWITWAGVLYAISGVCMVIVGFSLAEPNGRILLIAAGASAIVSGLFILACGAALRMIRAIGLVLLDISGETSMLRDLHSRNTN